MDLTEILQTTISGLALGANYAILALGFVIVFAATHVLNFAQGAFVLVGGYLTFQLGSVWGLPFALAVLVSMLVAGALAVLIGMTLMRRFTQTASFAAVMATVGLLFVAQAVISGVWGEEARNLGDPWGLRTVDAGGVALSVADLWTAGVGTVLLITVFALLRFTRIGLAMRAAVSDEEAAIAQGVTTTSVTALAWAIAGSTGAAAGVLLATGPGGVNSTLGVAAFAALPAMVLGGLDSPIGALVGGLIVGLAQQFAALLQPSLLEPLGSRFPEVMPYLVLILVLLLRPQGLFGNKSAQRL